MRVFSTFTGIGGFEIGIQNAVAKLSQAEGHTTTVRHKSDDTSDLPQAGRLSATFVGYSETDKYAISVYEKHFKGVPAYGDITKINATELPDFDCLVGGFPCQAFSIAGRRGGFDDTRGTLFFDLARILRAKRPRLFVFENVKGLLNHDKGRTFRTIVATIDELGYDCQWQVINSKNHGVPQNRERIIIVGHSRGTPRPEVFPLGGADKQDTRIIGQDVAYALDAGYHKGVGPDLKRARRSLVQVGQLYDNPHNSQAGRVYDPDGISPTLDTVGGGNRMPKVLVSEATKKGYAEATVGDSINLKAPNSKTRRGRVGKGIANTLETSQQQYTVQPVITPDRLNKRQNGRRIKDDGEPAFTVTAQDRHGVKVGAQVRRLTPLECERLQAFPDHWTAIGTVPCTQKDCERCALLPPTEQHMVDMPISDTQRYKMAGNAVTTNVIQAVFERILA